MYTPKRDDEQDKTKQDDALFGVLHSPVYIDLSK